MKQLGRAQREPSQGEGYRAFLYGPMILDGILYRHRTGIVPGQPRLLEWRQQAVHDAQLVAAAASGDSGLVVVEC